MPKVWSPRWPRRRLRARCSWSPGWIATRWVEPWRRVSRTTGHARGRRSGARARAPGTPATWRSEEHTSELQSRRDLVCRLLLEKKKKKKKQQLKKKKKKKKNKIEKNNKIK